MKQSVLRSTISAIVFVFHANDIEDGISNFIGLENQYFVRYSADDFSFDDIDLEPIPRGEFQSFGHQSSLPTQYYSFICRIQQCFKEGLCPRRWSERKRVFTKSFFLSNMDVWSIFKYHINLPIYQLKGTTKKTSIRKNIKLQSTNIRSFSEMIRVENQTDFERAQLTIGENTLIGTCKVFPSRPKLHKKGERIICNHDNLKQNDYVNTFLFPGEECPCDNEKTMKRRSKNIGFDIICSSTTMYVTIAARYICIEASNPKVKDITGNHCFDTDILSFMQQPPSNDIRTDEIVKVGRLLSHNEQIFRVMKVNSTSNDVTIKSDSNETTTITLDDACMKIRERLSLPNPLYNNL